MQILTQYEREKIEWYVRLKMGPREIGRRLRRDHGVIVRELERNRRSDGRYMAADAQKRADFKARKTNRRKLEVNEQLHDWVEARLKRGWSPELIAGRLKKQPPLFLKGSSVSHEQIYRYIYEGEGRYEGWYHLLHRKHYRRRKQRSRKKQAKTLIKERVSIHERPNIINARARFGDWESDLALFRKQREAVSVQYERKAMLIRLHKVANRTAEANQEAVTKTLESVLPEMARSLTFDNGKENACHTNLRDIFNLHTFFCDAYAAWQKGGVENAVGLIRRYLPKDANLATITDDELYRIQELLNNRPRKKLNYLTPNEALSGALNS
jgi:transposase, IS30 family